MASFRKLPSGKWYAEIMLSGVRDSKGGFLTKIEARSWADIREDEIRSSNGKIKTKKTLNDALTRFIEEIASNPNRKGGRWEIIRCNKFIREISFVGKYLDDIDVSDFAELRDLKLKTLKSSSVNREFNLLSKVFTLASGEWQWCRNNPVRDVERPKNPKHRERITSSDEKSDMLSVMGYQEGKPPVRVSQRVAIAYLIALETGMRASELCRIDKSTMFLKKRFVRLYTSKNDDHRDIPLSDQAVKLWSLVPDGLGLKPSQIDANWRKYRAIAEVVNLKFHDSRHQAITNLAKKLQILDLARMVGTRDIKTLMIYYNESATEIAKKL